ncbi:uncharacterized protein [Coffea arabica]|uniref:Uncharacterized protein isoform X2 n=1 Tax=Coffea arabica TaxID=13443 RepID=A0ABM4VLL9_COFAR
MFCFSGCSVRMDRICCALQPVPLADFFGQLELGYIFFVCFNLGLTELLLLARLNRNCGSSSFFSLDKSAFDWTVLVQVIEADCVKIARDGDLPRFLHRFAFGDLQGIKISAVVFDDDIAIVHGRLLPFRKYYISNAEVRDIPELVGTGLYSFYWVIDKGTIIQAAVGSGELALPFYLELRSFHYFHFVVDTDIFIR